VPLELTLDDGWDDSMTIGRTLCID